MYGHLTCPEIFWHVSDTRIGTISNPISAGPGRLASAYIILTVTVSAQLGSKALSLTNVVIVRMS